MSHLQEDSDRSKTSLASIKAKVQREVRALKNDWWLRKAKELEEMADNHDHCGLFAGLKAIYGPKTSPLNHARSADGEDLRIGMQAIKTGRKQHFFLLLNQQEAVLSTACDDIKRPTRTDLCWVISMTELMRALRSTASRKSPSQRPPLCWQLSTGGWQPPGHAGNRWLLLHGFRHVCIEIKLLSQPPPGLTDDPAVIRVHGEALNTSAHFTYLGTTETNSNSADLEVERWIRSATRAYSALHKCVWTSAWKQKWKSLLGCGSTLSPLCHRMHHPISETHRVSAMCKAYIFPYPRTASPPQIHSQY